MENTHITQQTRLRQQGERLLQALEASPAPETFAEILRAARALIAVKKALDLVHAEADGFEMKSDSASSEPIILNRQMRRRAEALDRKRGCG